LESLSFGLKYDGLIGDIPASIKYLSVYDNPNILKLFKTIKAKNIVLNLVPLNNKHRNETFMDNKDMDYASRVHYADESYFTNITKYENKNGLFYNKLNTNKKLVKYNYIHERTHFQDCIMLGNIR
jgi:hypothetical protein